MYREGKLLAYLEDAASKKPAPGGGSVSALAGALAAAMGEMVANFTAGRKKYADVEAEVRAVLARLTECRADLLELMDADVVAYGAVDAAYSMPAETDAQRAARKLATDKALRAAMQAPLRTMRRCAQVAPGLACNRRRPPDAPGPRGMARSFRCGRTAVFRPAPSRPYRRSR